MLTAKTVFGLEDVLAAELAALGAEAIEPGRRLVNFQADHRLLYRANIWLRTAIRVLRPIHQFDATDEKSLYDGVREIDWSAQLLPDGSLAIDPVVHNSFCTHSLYAAQLAKDAIVDQFRERGGTRPSVDLKNPDLRINLHLNDNRATIYLDSSGDSLHKRGYRSIAGEAPLNEVLAAGILQLSGWDRRSSLADFMCGSGTLPIEAVLWARNIAPGLIRQKFGYMRWRDFDSALHRELLAEARQAALPRLEFPITGSDLDPQAVSAARENARRAGVQKDVQFEVAHYEAARPPAAAGTLVTNPPYDERMKVSQAAAVYRRIGDALKHTWAGWTAFVFTGNAEAAKFFGLRPSRKIRLNNGAIQCQLLRFEVFNRAATETPKNEEVTTKDAKEAKDEERETTHHTENTDDEGRWDDDEEQTTNDANDTNDEEVDEEHDDGGPADGGGDLRTSSLKPQASSLPLQAANLAPQALSLPRRRWEDQAKEFSNRLVRMAKHWKKWARRQGITCFRLYDRDLPEVPLAIDSYEGHLHIAEYIRPHDRTDIEHQIWLTRMIEAAAAALEVDPNNVAVKRRGRQRGPAQYERQSEEGRRLVVHEGGHRFEVNLTDYLDTGLFLDHRITRAMVEKESAGKRFLNLFGYTGAFTVYAAAGGAVETTTVDLSSTYSQWAERNLKLNGFADSHQQVVRFDAMRFLRRMAPRAGGEFDLAVVDPPTFSNSKNTPDIFDVDRDHVELLNLVLERLSPGGKIYFSTNFRKFKFRGEEIPRAAIREISRQTVPPDFRNKRIHRCWTLVRSGSSG
ncbi:MAG TPA: bifunctional 23S rRNA (guanine(2069)-N(7))-methyltransferase RlmK/23S rRNA (guanine(2445)-N(2))-methyltransferase RlmL [Pirellulales bacterium]|nr:bifunctional 23S rRNA (guanine(2069)-N(7))-methyltransferase RlmK/23S rRNA (guanine(2445)-N(2))-methyltransferase RlmL [Pirellulales bacterium]